MKKMFVLLALALCVVVVKAETPVEKRASLVLGAATLSQADDYVVYQVKRVEVFGVLPVAYTGAIVRVSNGLTNSLGTIVVASGTGAATNLSEYLFKGDELKFTGVGTNAGTVRVTGLNIP